MVWVVFQLSDIPYQDHFSVEKEVVEADAITTFQVKGGGRYNLDDRLSAFANIGYVQKPPILIM